MLKNMKIRTSLLMGFGVTLLVSLILIAATLLMMNSQSDKLIGVIDTDIKACDLLPALHRLLILGQAVISQGIDLFQLGNILVQAAQGRLDGGLHLGPVRAVGL